MSTTTARTKADRSSRKAYRVCIDRPIPASHPAKIEAMEEAIVQNTKNAPPTKELAALARAGVSMSKSKLALFTGKMWNRQGAVLAVDFINGTGWQREQVMKWLPLWSNHCNIKFDFERVDPVIRISFNEGDGSWSAVGTDALVTSWFPTDQATMNLGWVTKNESEAEIARVILHEGGHALGCIHEHQNPKGGIVWNEEEVFRYFMGPPNYWTEEDVRFNVIQKYEQNQLNSSQFDRKSIMAYSFPAEFTRDGYSVPYNYGLSTKDKQYIAMMYPKKQRAKPQPKKPPAKKR